MKKINIFLLGALAMGFVGCDEAPEAPEMQSNPQAPVMAEGDISGEVAGVLAESSVLNLEDWKTDPAIEVFKFTKIEDLPEGAVATCKLELSNSEEFGRIETLPVTMSEEGVATVNAVDWDDAHIALFGKSPKEKTAYWRVPVYINLDGTSYRYNSTTYYAASGSVKETCMDAGFVIYDAYYMLCNATTWDLAQAADFRFEHSDKDVYDDPVFSYLVEVTQEVLDANGGGCYWKIASSDAVETGEWTNVYGPEDDGDENLDGMLVGDGKAQAGKLTAPGKYRFTINMEEMTYSIEMLTRPDFVAVPSNANGWGQDGPRLYWNGNEADPLFIGAARVNNNDGGFKFIWDDAWYGGDDGKIDAANPDNILAPADATALYWFTVSTVNMTYTITPIETLGVIGGGDWDNQRNLTPSDDQLLWEGDVQISGEWKIRMNGTWDMNYGGDMEAAVFNGGNFAGLEGMYHITVDFSGNRPKVTAVAK